MSSSSSAPSPTEIAAALRGIVQAQRLTCATLALLLYNHILTLDEEVKYFWSGSWSPLRVLFFLNRYFTIYASCFSAYALLISDPSQGLCEVVPRLAFVQNDLASLIVQATLLCRIWYTTHDAAVLRRSVAVCYIGSIIAIGILMVPVWGGIAGTPPLKSQVEKYIADLFGCASGQADDAWRLFVPGMFVYTAVWAATIIPAVYEWHNGRSSILMYRIVRNGGLFFSTAFATSLVCTLCALPRVSFQISTPAIYSNLVLVLPSIAASRLLFSMRSLASDVQSPSPDLLLSMSELSRVRWTPGHRPGEFHVEVHTVEDGSEYEMHTVDDTLEAQDDHRTPLQSVPKTRMPATYMSRVGTYDDAYLSTENRS